jgi:eukaryotic-like serine/threonine-protein kinase
MALEEFQDGRYRLVRLLGSGGMGEVYLMQDMRVNRQVAIKVIRSESTPYPDSTAAKDAARLFQREARAIAALEHPNILPLYDFGEETRDGKTMTYMVMPYCTEGTLASWLQQRGNSGRLQESPPLQPQDVVYLVEQAADALQYAHDHEVIHLDVKPSNFLLRSNRKNPNRPTLLLADFGIARSFTTVASSSLTIRGTPTTMAPEQWSSTPVPATDQYALAIMTYELLTGRPPFVGSMEQLMFHHFTTQPPPPSTFNSHLPAALDAVLLRALAKKPEERFPSIAAFASAFEQAAQTPPAEIVTDQQPSDASNLYATLAISQAEADAGISQMITLPGGRQVNVPVPAGAHDGQVIRLQDSDRPTDQAGALILTVAIKQLEKVHLAAVGELPNTRQSPDPVSGHDLPTVSTSEQ